MYVNYLTISIHIYIIKCPIITYPEWITYEMFKFSTTFFRSLYGFNNISLVTIVTLHSLQFFIVLKENIFLFFLFRYLKVASTTLLVISDSGNHSLLNNLVSSRYCRKFLIVLSSIRSSCRMDFILHSRRFSMYFLHSKILWCAVSSTLHSSQLLLCEGDFGGESCMSYYDS